MSAVAMVLRPDWRWTQKDLAIELQVSRQTVNALEVGRYDPSLPRAFRIARLFDLTIEEVFENEVARQSGAMPTSSIIAWARQAIGIQWPV